MERSPAGAHKGGIMYYIKVGVEVREIDSSWYQLEEYSGIIHETYEEAKKELREAKKKTKYAFIYRLTDKEEI